MLSVGFKYSFMYFIVNSFMNLIKALPFISFCHIYLQMPSRALVGHFLERGFSGKGLGMGVK